MVDQSLRRRRGHVWIWAFLSLLACYLIVCRLSAAPQNRPKAQGPAADAKLDLLFVETPQFAPGPLGQRFPQGSRIVRWNRAAAKSEPIFLTDGFFAVADPQINFEGIKVLFSGQKNKGERWQMWEMDLDGGNRRQITHCAQDCLRGAYLPADEIAFTVEDSKGAEPRSYLAVMKADGSRVSRITFGSADFQLETVLRDGRILASAPWPLTSANEDSGARALYTLRPDGTALESFRCEHPKSMSEGDADELQDGSLVFVRKPLGSAQAGGKLMRIPRGYTAAMSLGHHESVFESPRQVSVDELLVANARVASASSPRKFDLYSVRAKTGALGERIFADAKLSSIQPVLIEPHAVPKRYWGTINPDAKEAYFISLNSYSTADVPGGRIGTPIAQVRLMTLNTTDGQERSLGEAPVEGDGSFYVRVPANVPVRFILLDEKGQSIYEERSWVWASPGEQRGCTGCHGDKNIAPENHWPMTLKRFDTPTPLGDTEHALEKSQAN